MYWKDGIVGGTLCGTTTDPYGCIRNLEENGIQPKNTTIALLGNGGAAKAIAYTLLEQGNKLAIVCRNKEKGDALASALNPLFKGSEKISVFSFQEFSKVSKDYKIIINATSVGMTPNEDETPLGSDSLNPGQTVCDIVYAPPKTKLLKLAAEKGCKTITGEGMLVNQGLESFKKWFPEQVKGHTDEELRAIMRKGMEGI